MKDWTEQLITAAATIGIVLLFVFAVHRPRQRALADFRKQAAAIEQQLVQTQQASAMLMPLTRQVEDLRALAGRFEERIPQEGQVGPFLQQVSEQLRQAHLSSLEMRPASSLEGPRYTELPIRMGFAGKFEGIFAFLDQLEGLARTKRITDLNLTGEPGAGDSMRADLVLSIYCAKG